MAMSKMHQGGGKRAIRETLVPEEIEDEDEIYRMLSRTAQKHRENPMDEGEIAEGQKAILQAFGRTPTLAPTTQEARSAERLPFLALCRRVMLLLTEPSADAKSTLHINARGGRAKRTLQAAIMKVDHVLRQEMIYTGTDTIFGPIMHMVDSGRVERGSPPQRMFAADRTRALVSMQQLANGMERMTGLQLEGGIGMRKERLVFLVFDHNDTPRYGLLALFSVDPHGRGDLPRHPRGPSTDEASFTDGDGTDIGDVVLFDPTYFKRDDRTESPWAMMAAEFINYVYFDRLSHPYDVLIKIGK